jgi:hypothetical protein
LTSGKEWLAVGLDDAKMGMGTVFSDRGKAVKVPAARAYVREQRTQKPILFTSFARGLKPRPSQEKTNTISLRRKAA